MMLFPSRNDAGELLSDCPNESIDRWSELTPTRFGPIARTFSGLGSSRSTFIAWLSRSVIMRVAVHSRLFELICGRTEFLPRSGVRRVFHLPGLIALAALSLAGCTSSSDVSPTASSSNAMATNRGDPESATTTSRSADAGGAPALAASTARRIDRTRDAYVLLSGGGSPLSNNYSQYLQARAIADFFERECPRERTWIFFGAGNREGVTPALADTRRELKQDGYLVQSWLPATLPRNRAATRENFLRALREEILPLVREGGTLYLFVGDHGELAGTGEKQESAITMWQLKQNRRRSRSWFTDDKEILGVAELRQVLAAGLGGGRVVFGMTQCHGGGFHELGIAPEMIPPAAWFSGAPPAWAVGNPQELRLRVAGYTATDRASPAAGCEADPDPERWAGYERFLPESLLGLDLMSGQPKGRAVTSFAEAHEAATLVDQTIDKPRSTSEHFLEMWARLIETQLAKTLRVTATTQNAVMAFERAVDRGRVTALDGRLQERQAQFERFSQRLAEQLPSAKELLLTGTRQQLEAAVRGRGERGGGRGTRRGAMTEARRAWTETLRPAWKAAALDDKVSTLDAATLQFEKRLLKVEDDGRDLLLARGGGSNALMNEVYWASSYAEPATFDRAKAEAVVRWGAERRARIVEWAKASSDPSVRAAGDKIGPGPTFVETPPQTMTRKTAAERVLYYRRVLAAWEFLVTMRAEPALSELRTLIELESLPVRPEPASTRSRS